MQLTRKKIAIAIGVIAMVVGGTLYLQAVSERKAQQREKEIAEWNRDADAWCNNKRYERETCRRIVLIKLFIGMRGEQARQSAIETLEDLRAGKDVGLYSTVANKPLPFERPR